MIVALVQIPLPGPKRPEAEVIAQSVASADAIFRDVPGLLRKYYLNSEAGGGGVYVFDTEASARAVGLRHGPVDVMRRLVAGEDVDPSEYYFRTVPEFIAPDGKYDWLNRSIFICSGARYANSIKLWVWRVT